MLLNSIATTRNTWFHQKFSLWIETNRKRHEIKLTKNVNYFMKLLKGSFYVGSNENSSSFAYKAEKITRNNDIDHKLWRLIFWYRLEIEISSVTFYSSLSCDNTHNNATRQSSLIWFLARFFLSVLYSNNIYTINFITIGFLVTFNYSEMFIIWISFVASKHTWPFATHNLFVWMKFEDRFLNQMLEDRLNLIKWQ